MIAPGSGVRVYLACGRTDMRKGMDGLAMLIQQNFAENRSPPRPHRCGGGTPRTRRPPRHL